MSELNISYDYDYDNVRVDSNSTKLNEDKLEKFSYYILLLLSFLLPIFFIPGNLFPFQFGKTLLVSVLVLVAFSLWIISRLRNGGFSLPRNVIFNSAGLILVVSFISTLFSGSIMESFIGVKGEVNTLFFILILFILLFTSFKVINSTQRVIKLYITLTLSAVLLLILQLFRIFLGVDFLALGILNTTSSSLIGRWNDLGIFFGLFSLLVVISLDFLRLNWLARIASYILLISFLFFVLIINSVLVWSVLGFSSLLYFTFTYLKGKSLSGLKVGSVKNFLRLPLFIFLIAVAFIFFKPQVGTFITNNFNVSQLEARPSLRSTLQVSQNVLNQSPGFGVGLNRFSIEWGRYKPLGVNNTIFWNTDFSYGIGIIPSFLITNGILGFLAWIVFLGSILVVGTKSLFLKMKESSPDYVSVSSFLGLIYLWTFSVISVPGVVVFSSTFLLTGVLLASLARNGLIKEKVISFSNDSKAGFASIFILILILIVNIGFLYLTSTRYLSAVYINQAVAISNTGNLEEGLKQAQRAVALAKTDSNYRLLSQIHIGRLNVLLGNTDLSSTEEGVALFQEILGDAILSSQAATNIDSADYRNWMSLGNIYEAIIPLGVQGAYESAKETYQRAQVANPTNPSIDLAMARLEVTKGDNIEARNLIGRALQKKSNYTDAIFLLSQIEINEGNIAEATRAVEAASLLQPNNPVTFFQLGFLKFNQSDFDGAIVALERAVILNPPYSNAKYFLGLSYHGVGKTKEALLQFMDIEVLNPNNAEVKSIIDNLQSGRAPLSGVGQSPESRDSLPVEEE